MESYCNSYGLSLIFTRSYGSQSPCTKEVMITITKPFWSFYFFWGTMLNNLYLFPNLIFITNSTINPILFLGKPRHRNKSIFSRPYSYQGVQSLCSSWICPTEVLLGSWLCFLSAPDMGQEEAVGTQQLVFHVGSTQC